MDGGGGLGQGGEGLKQFFWNLKWKSDSFTGLDVRGHRQFRKERVVVGVSVGRREKVSGYGRGERTKEKLA